MHMKVQLLKTVHINLHFSSWKTDGWAIVYLAMTTVRHHKHEPIMGKFETTYITNIFITYKS